MPFSRLYWIPLAAIVLDTARPGWAQLTSASPFPPNSMGAASAAGPAADAYELSGVSTTPGGVALCISDKKAKRSRWIQVGATVDKIQVINFYPAQDRAVIRVGGEEKVLYLRRGSVTAGTVPTFTIGSVGAVVVNTLPSSVPAIAAPPAPLTENAKKEEEARMLVSDLMEIGIQQRKAYEEAQKAAQAKGAQATQVAKDSPNQR